MTVAMKLLLIAATADPDNQRFLLADETTLPLYSPAALYQQFVLEARSRIQACEVRGCGERWAERAVWGLR